MNSTISSATAPIPRPSFAAQTAGSTSSRVPDTAAIKGTQFEARPVRISRYAEESALYAYSRESHALPNLKAGQHIDEVV